MRLLCAIFFNNIANPMIWKGSPYGVVANVLDYDTVVSEFKLQSHNHVYF